MLASIPASMVNHKPTDLGIQIQLSLTSSRFSAASRRQGQVHHLKSGAAKGWLTSELQPPQLAASRCKVIKSEEC